MSLSQTQNPVKNPTNHDDKGSDGQRGAFEDDSAPLRANAMDSLRLSVLGGPLRQKDALNIRLLIRLRWLAIIGQATLVLLIHYGFGFTVPLWLCLAVISASVWMNLLLSLNARSQHHLKDWESALQLGFDTIQLAVLLGVTGGIANPFCLMLIAPATVAAANLPTRHAAGVVAIALAASIMLYFFPMPLPWSHGQAFSLPPLYRAGLLIAVMIGLVFTAGYAWQAALLSARMEQALNATRAVLEKEHRMSALGGLAAAAAHELGTPLGTIQVVAREMLNGFKPDDPLYEDAALLVSQSQRCRDILKSLSQSPDRGDSIYDHMQLGDFLDSVSRPLRTSGKTHHIEVKLDDGKTVRDGRDLVIIKRKPEWIHALSAFVENATDFAKSDVFIRVHIHPTYVVLLIEDNGPGFAPDILPKLGEPYISTRRYDDDLKNDGQSHSGMGLGFFIAKTLCEYTGAAVSFGNRGSGGAPSGAYVKVMWRRDQMDILLSDGSRPA
jgi:two-component system, sensor histidine kinase RegB